MGKVHADAVHVVGVAGGACTGAFHLGMSGLSAVMLPSLRALRKPAPRHKRQGLAHVLALDLGQRLADEGFDQQGARFRLGNAARAAIEQEVLVEVGAGRAVPANDVVGVDLELGLGIELRIRRQHQHLRHLLAVGFLRVRPHDDLALEDAARLVLQHALEQLAANAGRHRMIHDERRIHVLRIARKKHAGEIELGILALECDGYAVAREPRAGGELKAAVVGFRADIDEPIRQMDGIRSFERAFTWVTRAPSPTESRSPCCAGRRRRRREGRR